MKESWICLREWADFVNIIIPLRFNNILCWILPEIPKSHFRNVGGKDWKWWWWWWWWQLQFTFFTVNHLRIFRKGSVTSQRQREPHTLNVYASRNVPWWSKSLLPTLSADKLILLHFLFFSIPELLHLNSAFHVLHSPRSQFSVSINKWPKMFMLPFLKFHWEEKNPTLCV